MTIEQLEWCMRKYDFTISRIPDMEFSVYEIRHHKPGNNIIMRHGKEYTEEKTIPKNASKFIIQKRGDVFKTTCIIGNTIADTLFAYLTKLAKEEHDHE
jgi:hypothetical protein